MISTRQFYFSGITGGFLMASGTGLVAFGAAGGGLVLVGAAIFGLAVAFRFQGRAMPALQRIELNRRQDNQAIPGLNN